MKMITHGGHCCGIRTIHGFPVFSQTSYNQFFRMFTDLRDGLRDWTSATYIDALNERGALLTDHLGRAAVVLQSDTPADFEGLAIDQYLRPRYANRMVEIVLTDGQLQPTGAIVGNGLRSWLDALTSLGFRPVTRFRNSNSGRYCTVFHFVANLENNWEEAPVIRPTVVFTYYRKVYASGNVGLTMYPTIFEAFNGHRGRDPRVNRYEVMSDYSVHVTERLTAEDEE